MGWQLPWPASLGAETSAPGVPEEQRVAVAETWAGQTGCKRSGDGESSGLVPFLPADRLQRSEVPQPCLSSRRLGSMCALFF